LTVVNRASDPPTDQTPEQPEEPVPDDRLRFALIVGAVAAVASLVEFLLAWGAMSRLASGRWLLDAERVVWLLWRSELIYVFPVLGALAGWIAWRTPIRLRAARRRQLNIGVALCAVVFAYVSASGL
jgi:hypothetical protein